MGLDAGGLKIAPVGSTFIMDHCQTDGSVSESWLDHVYFSEQLSDEITYNVKNYGSSDHLPVIVCIKTKINRKIYKRTITKRRMKNFNSTHWNEALSEQDWDSISKTSSLDKKVEIFTDLINVSLDKVAPFGTFTIRSNYKFGLSDETKGLMQKREAARSRIKTNTGNQKIMWNEKYKKLRNKVTQQIRKDTINFNNNRIDNAKDENETWKVASEIINPVKENNWSMKVNNLSMRLTYLLILVI